MGVQVRVIGSGESLDLEPGSSFAIEMENPMLDDSGMPTAYSTQITFPLTPGNMRVFGYVDMLMFDPRVKSLGAELWICGVMMFSGTLVYDSMEDGKLNYTFSGKDVESEWDTKIWKRPILQRASGESEIRALFASIWAGEYEGLGVFAPVMVNRDMTASEDAAEGLSVKYHNHVNRSWLGGYDSRKVMTPVFLLKTVLEPEFRLITVDEALEDYLAVLVMVGLYKTDTDTTYNGWPSDKVELETSLPDVSGYEVLQGLLKIFCAALYMDGQGYRMMSAESVLAAGAELDWTSRVSDDWDAALEEKQGYRFSYDNADDENTIGAADAEDVQISVSLESALAVAINGTVTKHELLGDVYSGSNDHVDMVWHEMGNVESENEENTFDNSVDFELVRSVPDRLESYKDAGSTEHQLYYRMIPIVEPGDLGERGSKMYVGLMSQGQLSDKQVVFNSDRYETGGRWGFRDYNSGLSLAPKDLYGKFHKTFEAWIAEDRQVLTADLDLSPVDVANFRMWQKVLVRGREFLVKKLSFTFYADSDRIETTGDFLSV